MEASPLTCSSITPRVFAAVADRLAICSHALSTSRTLRKPKEKEKKRKRKEKKKKRKEKEKNRKREENNGTERKKKDQGGDKHNTWCTSLHIAGLARVAKDATTRPQRLYNTSSETSQNVYRDFTTRPQRLYDTSTGTLQHVHRDFTTLPQRLHKTSTGTLQHVHRNFTTHPRRLHVRTLVPAEGRWDLTRTAHTWPRGRMHTPAP